MAELFVALDHTSAADAFALLDQLPAACAVKVGSVLFTAAGPGFVRTLVAGGHRVFLDLKWHDIPNTVAGAVARAAELGVDLVTIHAAGGAAMIEAAAAAAGPLHVVAVTVLTSHDPASYAGVIGRDIADLSDEAERLARLAVAHGAAGVVCSAQEVGRLRRVMPGKRLVVPGIRRAADPAGDQQRVATPEAALAAGATDLVVGRPITAAEAPSEVYREIVRAIAHAS